MKKAVFKLKDLKMDNKLLSIRKVNPVFVSRYRQAYREGAIFPLMIVEERTGRIISGNHRYTAMMQEYGPDHEVEVIVRKYKSEKDVLIDFAKENSAHGNPIDGWTKKLLISELSKEGCTEEEISRIFNISVRRIEHLGAEMVGVVFGKNNTQYRPSKRGFKPPRSITQQQYKEHQNMDRGLPINQKVSEIRRWLNDDLIMHTDDNVGYVKSLRDACEKWLEKVAVTVE
jgi:hypothetical protein